MKPIDVKSDCYTEYNVDSNAKNAKFKIGDHVRFLNYKNIFAKGYAPNWSAEVFVIKRVKITVPRICGLTVLRSLILTVLAAKKLMEYFTKKNCRRQIKQTLELRKQSRKKVMNYMINGKTMIIRLIVGLVKEDVV